MLERKVYKQIKDFYSGNPHRAMMITGARQVGKSYIIEKFGRENYRHFVRVDFIEHPEYTAAIGAARNADEILLRMSAFFGDELVPGETLIFFDEVQECRELITQIKYLVQDGRFSYILSGSLLGTVFQDILSVPVGYLSIVRMYPLDFEDFAIANGISRAVLDLLHDSFEKRKPVDPFIHERFMALFDLYLLIGGMPAAVNTYLETKNLRLVSREQSMILSLYKQDISKYDRDRKLYLNEIFDLIPSELSAKNKRFILKNMNEHAKYSRYENSFLWLKNAGVALPVYIANEPKVPLILSKASNLFKLFSNDVGLLAVQYGGGIQISILNHETAINFGAIYENAAAQELAAHGYTLYFYNSKKLGELDFLIEEDGNVIPLEIKSGKDYYRHAAMNNVLESEEYSIQKGYVFCNGNIEEDGKITYFPIYMLMFLQKRETSEEIIFDTDFTDVNRMVR